MTLVVEDGTGYPNSDTYASLATCQTFAVGRNLPYDITDIVAAEATVRVATAYIDGLYRYRFPGFRTNRRAQALEWPRSEAYYYTPDNGTQTPYFIDPRAFYPFDLIPMNSVPPEIVTAVCIGAIKERAAPGTLQPDLERGGYVSQVKAGSVNVRYGPGATPNTVFQDIEYALSGLLARQSGFTARSVR